MNPAQPSPADHAAIEELTHLAAELTQRGQATQLITTPPPHLTLTHPGIPDPYHIHIQGEWLCWHDPTRPHDPAPFTLRTTPPHLAADRAQNVLKVFARAYHITHAPAHTPN
jgi:hypothetical protein